MWLASLSRRSPISGKRLSTQVWDARTMDDSIALLRRILGPAGDASRERIFRMQITLCIHRALSIDEIAALPDWFHTDGGTDLAGGPVEIIWESEEGQLSTRPCERPIRHPLDKTNPLLWFPIGCGSCPSCLARTALDAEADLKSGAAPRMIDELLALAR